jgi:hypothetical protein
MVKTYDLLKSEQEVGGHWSVSLAPEKENLDSELPALNGLKVSQSVGG